MWKIAVAFAAFAGLALYILTKSGADVDLGGEKHDVSAGVAAHAPSAPVAASAPTPASAASN